MSFMDSSVFTKLKQYYFSLQYIITNDDKHSFLKTCEPRLSTGPGVEGRHSIPIFRQTQVGRDLFRANPSFEHGIIIAMFQFVEFNYEVVFVPNLKFLF